ncbi:hypothetical protein KI387_023659, partial [Taxus chinensis]
MVLQHIKYLIIIYIRGALGNIVYKNHALETFPALKVMTDPFWRLQILLSFHPNNTCFTLVIFIDLLLTQHCHQEQLFWGLNLGGSLLGRFEQPGQLGGVNGYFSHDDWRKKGGLCPQEWHDCFGESCSPKTCKSTKSEAGKSWARPKCGDCSQ